MLFTGGPGGPHGMDLIDFMSWMWHGGGFDMMQKFYREPRYRPSPWLKRRAKLGVSLLTPE